MYQSIILPVIASVNRTCTSYTRPYEAYTPSSRQQCEKLHNLYAYWWHEWHLALNVSARSSK